MTYDPSKVFLTYQQRLLNSVFRYEVTVVEKSRRTGYSYALAAIAVMFAVDAEKAQDVYYMGYSYDMAREFIKYVGEWAKKIGEVAGEAEEYIFNDPDNPDKEIKAFRVSFSTGKEVVALSSVARAWRGKQGVAILDEAAFIENLKEVMKAILALLMWGGKAVIVSTHDGEDNPFNQLVNDIRAGKLPDTYNLLRCTFDDALKDGLYRKICLKLGVEWSFEKEQKWRQDIIDTYGEAGDEELFCIPSKGSGSFLTRSIVEKCQKEDIPLVFYEKESAFVDVDKKTRQSDTLDWLEETIKPILKRRLKPDLATSFGFDFGRNGDLSVLWVVQEKLDQSLYTPFVLEMRNLPHEQQKQILFYILDRLPNFNFGALDARGNGSYLAEVTRQEYGSNSIEEVMLTTEWYRNNMPIVKSKLEEQQVEVPLNKNILDDFRLPKMVKGVVTIPDTRTKDNTDNTKKRHADTFIALAFVIYASMQEKKFDYTGYKSAKELPKDDIEEDNRLFDDGAY